MPSYAQCRESVGEMIGSSNQPVMWMFDAWDRHTPGSITGYGCFRQHTGWRMMHIRQICSHETVKVGKEIMTLFVYGQFHRSRWTEAFLRQSSLQSVL